MTLSNPFLPTILTPYLSNPLSLACVKGFGLWPTFQSTIQKPVIILFESPKLRENVTFSERKLTKK